ncbi:hypothetical protein [Arthrobacter sp. Br18]|uniref:hypothetical protein n=1 Tax=Arthrobacter sp. Br18 TaxID=1312954 RepID=UPI00047A6858|nr:hypothetical protein [Arthrobacter sp. Br18]
MAQEHHGWHGIPPSADRFIAPVQLEEPTQPIHWTTENASPVWCDLTYPDDVKQTVKGFAMAWTADAVLVQWVEFSRAREAWVHTAACRRREIPKRERHRDG